jgi:hypothetical protein
MSKNLEDLNTHLFGQLDRLKGAKSPDELKQEILRAQAMTNVATQVVANASLALKAVEVAVSLKAKQPKKKPMLKITKNGVDQSPKEIVPEVLPSMLAIGPSVKS